MFKSRTNHLASALFGESLNSTQQTRTPSDHREQEVFQLELTIDHLSLDPSVWQAGEQVSPFIVIKVNGLFKKNTNAKRNNRSPHFRQCFLLHLENPAKDVVQIIVHDKEKNDDIIGQCAVDGLNQFVFGKATSLVIELDSGSKMMTGSSFRSNGSDEPSVGCVQIDVKPINFGMTENEAKSGRDSMIKRRKSKRLSLPSKDALLPTDGKKGLNIDESVRNKPYHQQLNVNHEKSNNKEEGTINEEFQHEGGVDSKRKSAWFSTGQNSSHSTPVHETSFNFEDFTQSFSGGQEDFDDDVCPFEKEGEKEYTKTKQQYKLLYIMAIDIQMFGERVTKLEELLEKWKDPKNDTEKLQNQIKSVYHKAEKKRGLLDSFIPKLSKKLPKATNCKLTIMKLAKLKQQFEIVDARYQNLLKVMKSLERQHKKKRMEQLMEFDQLIDQVLYQDTLTAVNSGSTDKETKNKTKENKPKVSEKRKNRHDPEQQKELFMEAIMAGARDSGADDPNFIMKKQEQYQQEMLQKQEKAQQRKLQFILSTADADTIGTEEKIALETKKELETVEKDYAELHEMFVDLNTMIRQQSEGLNIIEGNIKKANELVQEGTEYIKAASSQTVTGLLTGGFTKAAVLKKLIF